MSNIYEVVSGRVRRFTFENDCSFEELAERLGYSYSGFLSTLNCSRCWTVADLFALTDFGVAVPLPKKVGARWIDDVQKIARII